MPLFVINAIDKPDGLATRLANRDAHVAFLNAAPEHRLAGPYINAAGDPVGSLLVIEVEDITAAHAFAARDPYAKAGLFAEAQIRPWKHTLGKLP